MYIRWHSPWQHVCMYVGSSAFKSCWCRLKGELWPDACHHVFVLDFCVHVNAGHLYTLCRNSVHTSSCVVVNWICFVLSKKENLHSSSVSPESIISSLRSMLLARHPLLICTYWGYNFRHIFVHVEHEYMYQCFYWYTYLTLAWNYRTHSGARREARRPCDEDRQAQWHFKGILQRGICIHVPT